MLKKLKKTLIDPEERISCGYLITRSMKRTFRIQLELLHEVLAICSKYSINCFAVSGTLLGAIRHRGFIPWDDDIDIGMPRIDFDKFSKIAEKELPKNIKIWISRKEKGYSHSFMQLSDMNTGKGHGEIEDSIFIDIFPIDGLPSKDEEKIKKYVLSICDMSLLLRQKNVSDEKWIERVETRDSELRKYSNYPMGIGIGGFCLSGWNTEIHKYIWNYEDFNKTELHRFENMQIPIPKGYERILYTQYEIWDIPKYTHTHRQFEKTINVK